jgi:hypothetical protein
MKPLHFAVFAFLSLPVSSLALAQAPLPQAVRGFAGVEATEDGNQLYVTGPAAEKLASLVRGKPTYKQGFGRQITCQEVTCATGPRMACVLDFDATGTVGAERPGFHNINVCGL